MLSEHVTDTHARSEGCQVSQALNAALKVTMFGSISASVRS